MVAGQWSVRSERFKTEKRTKQTSSAEGLEQRAGKRLKVPLWQVHRGREHLVDRLLLWLTRYPKWPIHTHTQTSRAKASLLLRIQVWLKKFLWHIIIQHCLSMCDEIRYESATSSKHMLYIETKGKCQCCQRLLLLPFLHWSLMRDNSRTFPAIGCRDGESRSESSSRS